MATANPLTDTAPPVGLINTAPGVTTVTPGSAPPGGGSGVPVTSYQPAAAAATPAQTSTYTPNAYTVAPKATVASQIKDIIDSGSPLMEQAETNAKNQMNSRGLINSSMAVGAGQNAVIAAATPIATADASTYAQAGRDTTSAQNTALASEAAAKNTAGLQDATQQTATSQFNTGQTNAALSTASGASNTAAQQAQQNTANLDNIKANRAVDLQISQLTTSNQRILQTSQGAQALYSQMLQNLSNIITNPNMSEAQKTTALNDGVQQLNDGLAVMSTIAGIPDLKSLLNFGPAPAATTTPGAAPDTTSQPTGAQDTGIINAPAIPGPAGTPTGAGTPSGAQAPAPGNQGPGAAASHPGQTYSYRFRRWI